MAQRVAIAVALAAEPDLLVADEPTTGLDWSIRREVVDLLGDLARNAGVSLVLISHDFAVVRRLADRVLVFYRGELVEDGPRGAFFDPGPGRHPYAVELQQRARALAEGRPPPPTREEAPADAGCGYAHRCARLSEAEPDLGARCRTESPGPMSIAPAHRVRCFAARGEGS
jgi:ABC-type dipeptide/oligopeptide/nickel transport system ATPase component